jgi:vitamin B12 transporter
MQGHPSRNDSHCLAGKPCRDRDVVPCQRAGCVRVPLQRPTGGSDAVCLRNTHLTRITTKTRAALAAVPLIAALSASAAHAEAAEADTIVVTAFRAPVAQEDNANSVTVLDAEQLAKAQPIAVSDILLRTPGVSMSRNGGYGGATSLRIRGADAGETVMVIDGMRLSDPSSTAGGYSFSNLMLDDIERIEILRGPQSILWGSDAIGGVVNVTTRKPVKPFEGSFAAEGGSNQTVSVRAGLGGTSQAVDWRLAGSTFTTDGISARSNGTEPDGYTRHSGSGTVTVRLAPGVSLDLRGYWSHSRNDFDGSSGDSAAYGLTAEWSGYAGLNFALLDGRLVNRVAVLQAETDRENYDPARRIRQINFDAHGRVRRFEYQGTYRASDKLQLVFGAERDEQRMTSASPSNSLAPYTLLPNAADTNSVYGQVRFSPLIGLTFNAGARYDHQSRFGGNSVVSAGAAYTPDGGATILRASFDEGYKAPSLYQMFSAYGVADLRPEKAKGWEVGVEHGFGKVLRLSAAWFHRDTENLIDFAYCPTSGAQPAVCFIPGTTTTRFGYYANIANSQARGLELTATVRLGMLFAEGNHSWIKAEDRSAGSAFFGRQLARVPRHLANLEAGVELSSGLRGSVAARYAGPTFNSASSTAVLGSYWLVDLRAQWKVAERLTLQARVENLADKRYETATGYSALGRTIYVGVRSRF